MNTRLQAQMRPAPTPIPCFTPMRSGLLQRTCVCGQHTIVGGECEECRKNQITLQRGSGNQAEPITVPPIVYDVLRSPGQPLDPATRAFFEPRFGHDFSRVRVHTDARASESTRAVKALAYTFGHDIAFRAGRYSPASESGMHLMAHELEHVVSQTTGRGGTQPRQLGLHPEDKPLIPIPVFDKFDPCVIVPDGLPGPLSALKGQKVCGETAKKIIDLLRGRGGGKSEKDCSPFIGFERATSGEFKGQCCYGILRSKENCCPWGRISLGDGRCCQDDEIIQDNHCVKAAKVPQPLCLPGETRNLFGECCSPGQVFDRHGNPCPVTSVEGPRPKASKVPSFDIPGLSRPKRRVGFGTIESMTIDHLEVDKDNVPGGYEDQLDHLVGLLQVYSDVQVHVEGHTDSTFTRDHNKKLSIQRAESVKKALIERDLSPDRIILKGFGEERLLFPKENDTEEKARNRRVEIWFHTVPVKGPLIRP